MKRTILTLLITSFLFSTSSKAFARDKDWAAAGKVLTGIIGLGILADALDSTPHHYEHPYNRYAVRPYYCPPPVVSCPPPCVNNRWIPGHYEIVEQQVFIPGETRRLWVDPQYVREWHNGCPVYIQVKNGHYRCETTPGHYETRSVQQWVDGYWANC
jgi:hypothetical protein